MGHSTIRTWESTFLQTKKGITNLNSHCLLLWQPNKHYLWLIWHSMEARWQSAGYGRHLHDKHVISLRLNKSTTWTEILIELLYLRTKLVSRITINWNWQFKVGKGREEEEEEDKICVLCLERPNLSHRHAHIQEEDCLANHTCVTESAEIKLLK